MKKVLFGILMLPFLWTAACKKSETAGAPSNSWVVNGNTHKVIEATCNNIGNFNAIDSFYQRAIVLFGGGVPKVNAVYKVVAGAGVLNNDEAIIGYSTANGNYYYATGYDDTKVTVKIINGRVNVSFPRTWIKSQVLGDSLSYSGNMTQTR